MASHVMCGAHGKIWGVLRRDTMHTETWSEGLDQVVVAVAWEVVVVASATAPELAQEL